jgi:hypothetical protein
VAEAPPPLEIPPNPGTIAPSADAGTHTGDTIALEPVPEATPSRRVPPPSTLEAVDVVDRFWRAYQARDPDAVRALFAPDAIPEGKILDVDPTGGGALVQPADRLEAKPVGDRVTVRVPFLLSTHDDHGRAIRRRGVATWEIAMRDGSPRIVALASEAGPVPRR